MDTTFSDIAMPSPTLTVPLSYPKLDAWPTLPMATDLWLHFNQDTDHIYLGTGILADMGLHPGDHYTIAQCGTLLLLWKALEKDDFGHFTYDVKKPLAVRKPANSVSQPYAAVSCDTHIVVGPLDEVAALAPSASKRRGFHGRRQAQLLTEDSSEFPLTAEDILAWTDLKGVAHETVKVTHITGRVLNVAGLHDQSGHGLTYVRPTRFANGLFLAASHTSSGGLTVSCLRGAHSRIQMTTKLLPFEDPETYRAIATKTGLFVVRRDQPEAELCSPKTKILGGDRTWLLKNPHTVVSGNEARLGGFVTTEDWVSLSKPGINTAYYPRDAVKNRLQVHGQWLNDYGFVAGARFRVEQHPSFKARLRAVLDPLGPHKVTSYGNTPKLYVPEADLADKFDAPFIRVIGVRNDGLHLTRAMSKP